MGRVSGESSEGVELVLTVKLRGAGVIQRVGDVAAHPSSGIPRGPPGSGRRVAVSHHRSVGCRQCRLAVGVVGCCWCCLGWLVVVVRGMVTPRHTVWLCKDVTCGTK